MKVDTKEGIKKIRIQKDTICILLLSGNSNSYFYSKFNTSLMDSNTTPFDRLTAVVQNFNQVKILLALKRGLTRQCDLIEATSIGRTQLKRELRRMIKNKLVTATPVEADYSTKFDYRLADDALEICPGFEALEVFAVKKETVLCRIINKILER